MKNSRSPDLDFKLIGPEKIGGYECQKIEASYGDERLKSVKFIFYAAKELKNLVIFQQTILGQVTMTMTLSNVSLNVSPKLFRIPAGYRRVREKSYDDQTKELLERVKQAAPSRKPE